MIREDKDIKLDELILTEITTIMGAHTGPGISQNLLILNLKI